MWGPRGWDGVLRWKPARRVTDLNGGAVKLGDGEYEVRAFEPGGGGNLGRRERDSRAVPGAVHAGHERREVVRGENVRAGGCD